MEKEEAVYVYDLDKTLIYAAVGHDISSGVTEGPLWKEFVARVENGDPVYILTARDSADKPEIEEYLGSKGVTISDDCLVCTCSGTTDQTPKMKGRWLGALRKYYHKVYFWDDNFRNCAYASKIPGVITTRVKRPPNVSAEVEKTAVG